MFTNLKNEWFGTGVETNKIADIIEHLVWLGDLKVEKVRSGFKITSNRSKFIIKFSEINHNGMVWVPISFMQAFATIINRRHLIPRFTMPERRMPSTGEVIYVSARRSYKQVKYDPTDVQHELVARLGLFYREPECVVKFSRAYGMKANVFYSISGIVESPDDFLKKIDAYTQEKFVKMCSNWTSLW